MPEHIIGANPKDVIHHLKTREGSLTFAYNKRDIVANTIGHVLAVPLVHTMMWTLDSAFRNPSRELATQLFERYKDVPWKGDVLVRVGHVNLFGDLQRIFAKNEDVRGRPWMLKDKAGKAIEYIGKLGAAIITTGEAFWSKFTRSDYYNVFSNTAVVYHPKLAFGMHEIGHAEYWNQMDQRSRAAYIGAMINNIVYLPFLRSNIEWQASANAMKRFKNDTERRQGLKILEAAWGTYLARDALITTAMFAPALALPLLNSGVWAIGAKVAIGGFEISKAFGATYAMYGSSLAGHLMNRLYPKKDERFGYIFEGKEHIIPQRETKSVSKDEPKPPMQRALSAHQVLVATAVPVHAGLPKDAGNPSSGLDAPLNRQYGSVGMREGKRLLHSNTHRISF